LAELILESIWGVGAAVMSDDTMATTLTNLGQSRAPAGAPAAAFFIQEDKIDAAFPKLGAYGSSLSF
jgi:hypothetical protein